MDIPGYRIEERIGEGGMSEVYRAEQLSLKRRVAIKFLSEQLLNHPTARNLFENEPLIVAQLNHPKIIHVIDKGITSTGKPFFVMEFVEGVTLHDIVQDKSLPMSKKFQYLIQICRGLAFAHRNGIIHRDIKPANVVIDGEDNARILDFGIASFYTDERFTQKSAHQVLGTDRYMAPEVKLTSENASILSDIYSLGVLMFEVLSENFTDPASQKNVDQSNIPNPIKKLINKCIATTPEKRPSSADVIENQLLHTLKGAHLALSQKQNAEKDIASLSKNFTLLEVLSETEYGNVYLFEKNKSNDLIIIKKRHQDASGLKEAKLLSTLKHPNIINVYGTASNQRAFIVVMEYMDAGSLADRLIKPADLDVFFSLAEKLVAAMNYAHQNRILHGNIRPSNILFSQSGDVKITDFGLSEHYYHQDDRPNWYSPEKVETVSPAFDIFALGSVFYHVLTGQHLEWKNEQIAWTEPYSLLPRRLQKFLLKMMALDPSYRFQSMKQVQEELKQIQKLPKSKLARRIPRQALKFKQKAKQSLPFFRWLRRVYWIIIFALAFLYVQIYFFLPEIKTFIHQELKQFLLWWASKL
ncbi:MAG: serine/threonine protein kinase [Gammaproteobacteria bacterium]|nr:serine/threonine protein kinase [Gammaproteobacteria bacterium]